MHAHLRTPPASGGPARRSDGPLRSWRTAVAVVGLAVGSSLLVGNPAAGGVDLPLGEPEPALPAAFPGIRVAHEDGAASATVTEIMPGFGGELELVDVTGRVVDRAALTAATPAELTADGEASYRLRFRQEAATTTGEVSLSGLAMSASTPFDLVAGDVVVAIVAG